MRCLRRVSPRFWCTAEPKYNDGLLVINLLDTLASFINIPMVSARTTNWVVAGISLAAVATAVYMAYRQLHHDDSAAVKATAKKSESGKVQRKKKKRPFPSSTSSSTAAVSSTAAQPDTTVTAPVQSQKDSVQGKEKTKKKQVDCDSPIEDILTQSPEVKQQLFMEMMMRGEFFIQQGVPDRAIDYLVKGLGMIPNPGEVLLAFEQTLPEPVFKSLLERLQREGRKRVKEYFDGIHGDHPQIQFSSKESKNEMTGHAVERWFMKAAQDFSAGEVIFSEPADLISNTVSYFDESSVAELKYVKDSEQAKEAFMDLLNHCRETKSSAGLLLFKYISLLLDAELDNGQAGMQASGPFAHYDHLRPAFRQPNSNDLKEAKLLRLIFTRSNPNMQDFLTDDIYAAMKYTMLFNCYGFIGDSSNLDADADGKCQEIVRNVGASNQAKWIGLYHIASHIDHSCRPNAIISMNEADQSVTVKAITDIAKNDPINLAYLPGCQDLDKEARQIALLSKFGIVCECDACREN